MRVEAMLDAGLRGPGIVSRKIRLAGGENGFGVWEGEIHASRGMIMKSADFAEVVIGRRESGFLSLLKVGRWDILLNDKLIAVANVRREKSEGFEIGPVFYPVSIGDYAEMPVIEGEGWRLDRGVMNWPDVRIEGDSMEDVLAVSGLVAFYEGVLLDR